jgi:dTDP-glucose 4,6-dehydratase
MRKILVTGGAGFIGSNFILYYLSKHPQDVIVNLDALTYAGNLENLRAVEKSANYKFIKGDIRDKKLMEEVTKGIEVIVHFAAESHVDRSILTPEIFLETNVLGTFNLLEAALKNKVGHFHHVSTDEVFGSLELEGEEKFTLETAYQPRSPYSASKAASDHLVRSYGETYGLSYTITNCSNNYGPYQFPEKLFGLAITNLIEGKKVPVYGDGLNVRDWLFVTDHVKAIEKILLTGKRQQTFLVGGAQGDISNFEVVKMILTLMNKTEAEIEWVKDRAGHDRRYSIDWSKTERDLAWRPEMSLEQGLKETIAWYQTHEDWWRPLKKKVLPR